LRSQRDAYRHPCRHCQRAPRLREHPRRSAVTLPPAAKSRRTPSPRRGPAKPGARSPIGQGSRFAPRLFAEPSQYAGQGLLNFSPLSGPLCTQVNNKTRRKPCLERSVALPEQQVFDTWDGSARLDFLDKDSEARGGLKQELYDICHWQSSADVSAPQTSKSQRRSNVEEAMLVVRSFPCSVYQIWPVAEIFSL